MATLAELKLIVDSSQLEHAKKVLDEFGVSASNVESSSEKISKGVKSAGDETEGFSSKAQRLIDKATEMVETFNQGSAGVLSYRASLEGVGGIVDPLVGKFNSLKDTQKEYVEVSKEVVRSQQQVDSERLKMISSLKEEIALFGKSKEEIRLYRAEQLGIIDTVAPLVGKLEELKKAKEDEAKAGAESAKAEKQAREEALKLAKEEAAEQAVKIERARNLQAINSQLAAHEKQMAEQRKSSLKKDEEIAELRAAQEGSRLLAEEKRKLAEQAKQNAIATQKEKDEFVKLRGEIDPVKGAYEKLYVQLEKIENIRKKTKSSAQIVELNELEAAVHRNIKQLDTLGATTGKTAKEMAFSMRGLPAQFTDIVVSLQGGQKPLTVLLQQGGQIKDMFGGIVPAFKSMGAYVLGLITPLNLAIAGVGALAVGWYAGSKEASNFNRTLLITGQQSKITTKELVGMSASMVNSYTTIGKASSVLNEVVATGNILRENYEAVTRATLDWSTATGVSVSDIVGDFKSLAVDPVNVISNLQEKYKFLTVEVYNAAKAQLEMGRNTDATKILTEQLASTLQDRSAIMVASLSPVEKLLFSMKQSTAGVVDWFKGVGRGGEVTRGVVAKLYQDYINLEESISKLKLRIEETEKTDTFNATSLKRRLVALQEDARQAAELYQKAIDATIVAQKAPFIDASIKLDQRHLSIQGDLAKLEKERLGLLSSYEDLSAKGFTTKEQELKQRELLLDIDSKIYDLKMKSGGKDVINASEDYLEAAKMEFGTREKVGAKQREYLKQQQDIADLQKKIDEGKAKASEVELLNAKQKALINYKTAAEEEKAYNAKIAAEKQLSGSTRNDAATKMLQSMVRQSEVLKEQLSIGRTLGAEERKLVELKQRMSDLELKSKKGILTLDEQRLLVNKESLISQQRVNAELEKSIRLKKQADDLSKIQSGLDVTLSSSKNPDQLEGMGGLSDKESERIKERISLRQEESRVLLELAEKETEAKSKNPEDAEFYAAQIEMYKKHYADRLVNLDAYYAKEEQMRQSWKNGFERSYKDYAETALDVSKQTEGFFSRTFTGLEDTMVTFLTTGKASFKDFAVSILADIARIATQMVIANALMAAFGGGGGAVAQADGGAWAGGVQMFAKGGAFTNTVVSKPTMFKTATGLGVMGEAGAEAILPLTRTSSGELGVKAVGGVDSGVINNNSVSAPVNVQVNVVNNSEGGDKPSDSQNQGRDIQLAIKGECDKAIMNGLKTGGSIWKAINGR